MICSYCKFIGTFAQENNKDWYCPICLRKQEVKENENRKNRFE